jgi:hypothetical protein
LMGGWDQNGSWGYWLGSVEGIQVAQNRDRLLSTRWWSVGFWRHGLR